MKVTVSIQFRSHAISRKHRNNLLIASHHTTLQDIEESFPTMQKNWTNKTSKNTQAEWQKNIKKWHKLKKAFLQFLSLFLFLFLFFFVISSLEFWLFIIFSGHIDVLNFKQWSIPVALDSCILPMYLNLAFFLLFQKKFILNKQEKEGWKCHQTGT